MFSLYIHINSLGTIHFNKIRQSYKTNGLKIVTSKQNSTIALKLTMPPKEEIWKMYEK